MPQAGQYLLRQKPAGLDGQGRPRGFVYVYSPLYLGIYITGKRMFKAQLPKCACMPYSLVGVRSHKIKWLSHQGEVDIKALPGQPYANQPQAALSQLGDEPQPQVPKILGKVSSTSRENQDS